MISSKKYVVAKLERFTEYDVKMKDLNTHIELRRYGSRMLRKKEGIDTLYKKESPEGLKMAQRGSSMMFTKRSSVKSYETLTDLVQTNLDQWISFLTLTFAENLTDLTIANKKFNVAMKVVRRKFPDFKYIGVPEFQERGAVHYHLMTNIRPGCDLLPRRELQRIWRPQTKTWVNLYYYDFPWWDPKEYGLSSAFTLEHVDENFSVLAYLGKYFWKNNNVMFDKNGQFIEGSKVDLRLFNRIKILHSRNLTKPEVSFLDLSDPKDDLLVKAIELVNDQTKDRKVVSTSEYVPDVHIKEFVKGIKIKNK